MGGPRCIETPRLVLRKPEPADAAAILSRYASDPEVTRYLSWPRHESIDDTREFLELSEQAWNRSPAGPSLIESRAEPNLLGCTGLDFKSEDAATTGYVLSRDSWGKGFATEALAAIVDVARDLGVRRLSAECHPDNAASVRVLKKCGFLRDESSEREASFPNLAGGVTVRCLFYVRTPQPVSRPS